MDAPAPAASGFRRLLLSALLLYAAGILLVLSPIGAAAGLATPSAPDPPFLAADAEDPAAASPPPITDLTPEQHAEALAVLQANPSFRAVMRGRPFVVARSGPWTTYGGEVLLGASFVLILPTPIELANAELPGALYDVTERRSPPYQEVVNRVDASGVRELLVLVDLGRRKLVNVSPGPGSEVTRVTPPPGFRRVVPMPNEGRPSGRGS